MLNTMTASLFAVVLAILFTTGCEQIRKLTYPQDFRYIEDAEVEKIMQKMQVSMTRLDTLIKDDSRSDIDKQADVINELNRLDDHAREINDGGQETNQFVISDHIAGFTGELANAKILASLDPPRYDKAQGIVHGCARCHNSE